MFSLRIVNSDFYTAAPIPDLDVCHSIFRISDVKKVPIIRIYGATPNGQKTCLHVHGVFPYIYIPYDGTQPTEKYVKQFATSVDFAVQVALGKASSSVQHVKEISVVKGIPYYGYHEGEKEFLKISLYNPFLVTRIVSLLQNGAVMNKVFQPHEAHIPYLLQFFMDYNLYGMNLLHASSVRFRAPIRIIEGEIGNLRSELLSPDPSPPKAYSTQTQLWHEGTVPSDRVLGSDVERLSICELEVDILASDILNKLEIGANIGTNPGLAAIWEDEQQRRREANENSQIASPPSPDRGVIPDTKTERRFKEKIREIIAERDMLIQSQMERLGREALSPQELSSYQDSISSLVASQKDLVPENQMDGDAVSQLLSQHIEGSPLPSSAQNSFQIIDEDEPIVNQSIVQDVVEASQRSFSQELSSSVDKEMVDILASLAEDADQPLSQKTPLSQSIVLDQGDVQSDEEAGDEEELSMDEESFMMSQKVWDDVEPRPAERGVEKTADNEDVNGNTGKAEGHSQFNLEGLSDTWTGSFLSATIPQVDGAGDEESTDLESIHGTSKKTRGECSETFETTRKRWSSSDTTGESFSEDVWPPKGRIVRTYSKRQTSSLKLNRSPQPKDQSASVSKKNKKDDSEQCGRSVDTFSLVLSESSESEDTGTSDKDLKSTAREVEVSSQRTKTSDRNETTKGKTCSVTLRKRGEEEHGSYTAVITRYAHSPQKMSGQTKGTGDGDKHAFIDRTTPRAWSSKSLGNESRSRELSKASIQKDANLRKRTFALTDKKPLAKSERMITRGTVRRIDALMSNDAVVRAMPDVSVPLNDVSSTSHLISKFAEAQVRLRKRKGISEGRVSKNSGSFRKGRRPKRNNEPLLQKSKTPTSPKKAISPRKKEERMNRYGALTVVVKTSPKKNQSDEIKMQGESADQSLGTEPCKHVDSISLVSGTTLDSTARDDGRDVRTMEGTSSQYPSLGSAPSGRPKLGKQSCGNVSSDTTEASPQDRTRDLDNEKKESNKITDTTFHKKQAVKRKLELDVDKDLMSTSTLRSVVRKKRKTSLQLSLSKRGSIYRADRFDSSVATSSVGSVPKQDILTPCDKQHNGDNNETDRPMFSDEESLDEVTCVPCSPIESEDSENLLRCSVHLGKVEDPFCLSVTRESDPLRLSAVSCNSDSKLNENASEQSSDKQHLPPEKETDLLANALFNMSYPSPLPDMGQSSSPPSPSSPLDIAQDRSDLKNTQSWFQRLETSAPSEDVALSDLESTRRPRFSESQVSSLETDSSDVDLLPKERSRQLHMAPQLGETQTEIESTPIKVGAVSDMKMTRSELIEIEVPARERRESFEGREVIHEKVPSNNGNSFVVEKGSSMMEVNYTEGKDDVGSCLEKEELSICEDMPRTKLENHIEINSFCPELESCGSADGDEGPQLSGTQQMDTSSSMQNSNSNGSLVTSARQLVVESNEGESVVQGLVLGEGRQRMSASERHQFAHSALKIRATKSSQGKAQSSGDLDIGGLTSEGSSEKPDCKRKEDTPCFAQETFPCLNLHSTDKSRLFDGNAVVITPVKRPPSSQDLLSTLKDHGLPQCRYKEPFCSDPDDIPGYTGEVGGRYLRVESNQVVKLTEFESTSSLQGLKHWRLIMSASHESSFSALCQQTLDDASNVESNLELQIALMGDGDIVVTPARSPPAPKAVKAWARDKLSKLKENKLQKPVNYAGKPEERIRVDSAELSEKKSSRENRVDVNAAGTQKEKTGQTSQKIGEFVEFKENGELQISVAPEKTTPVGLEAIKKVDEKESSASAYLMEIKSPCTLFSPEAEGVFTFGSEQQNVLKPGFVQGLGDRACNVYQQNEGLGYGTQPMNVELYQMETSSIQQGDVLFRHKAPAQAGLGTENNPPLRNDSLLQLPSSIAPLPMSPTLETQKSSLSPEQSGSPLFAVCHSTPMATTSVYDVHSPICTPIMGAVKDKSSVSINRETSSMKHPGKDASSNPRPALRTQLLASQFKFVTPQPRHLMAWSSQIEGPSPNNTYGFKVTQMNLKDAKALHEVQHLTLFSLELHVRTRRDLRPDPEFDPICAIFYYIQTDTPLPSGKSRLTGIICVDAESYQLCSLDQASRDNSLSNAGKNEKPLPCTESAASTSTSNISVLNSSENAARIPHRPLLARSGVTACDVEYVAEEKDLFDALVRLIHRWDPDILVGYEVQLFSWGFLLERALTLEIDLCSRLSRVKGSSSESNMDAEKDLWGAAHTSEIKIAGRIILNVWRLMRHEVTLNSYTFENVAFHVLHERIPLYTFRTLSDWWNQRTALNRWRTVDHYVKRCRGNVRILETVDFIGRTSELARLFGILFFSVISRGSQYRVESMMLRIAKPMNYIAVSPSVEQRGAMRAPETIPLVMEPESRFYSDPVLVLDFQSLYPSMIIAYNYCFSTCLGRVSCLSEYGDFKFGATSLCIPPSLLKKLEDDIQVSPSGVAFVKPSVRKGVLPSMLSDILQTRIMVKSSMKKWKGDKALGRMLDARQLGLKLIANVTFGYTSAHFSGRMPCVEIGDSIVRKARETLERAIELVNNTPRWGARVVYGDTDSMFVLLKGVTKEQAFSIGQDIVQTVTALNPKPVKLKFEKVYLPCVLQTKKRYVGYMYETLDQKEPVFDAKGIETVRRDGCPAVTKILEKSLRILFDSRDLSLVKKFVQRQCTKLMQGRVSLQDFTFAKEYRGMKNYKPGACVPALELTRRFLREDRRSEPRVGERVPYVVVYGSPGLPLIQLVRRPQEVLQDPGLRLNASYYITKQILPPLNRVFSLIGINVFLWYAELPRVVRVVQRPTEQGERKKGTISQYFVTMTCPVCQELTSTDLCSSCRAKPQHSTVVLANRVRGSERTYQHLAEICYNCCGSRDPKLRCVSLDCPVFHKLVHTTRDVNSSTHLRRLLDSF